MTRKRVGAGLIEVFSENCEHCNGRGIIVSADPIDRPSTDDGGSPSGGSGGSAKGGGGDAGSGRGTRGRRSRGSGRDNDVSVAPEPKITPGGPTPAQIAAAAHAAPIHAVSHEEPGAPFAGEIVVPTDLPADLPTAGPTDVPVDVPVEAGAPAAAPRSRRRASRAAKSPVVSVTPVVELVTPQVEPAPVQQMTEQIESVTVEPATAESAPPSEVPTVPEVTATSAPASRGRRKRARVVAPAGPPRVGEFDS
jgi:ribonuclease E